MELELNNGVQMPALGFGVYQIPPEDTAVAVSTALESGYRLIDTAAAYLNEQEVGEGIRRSGIPRDQIFIETKVWINDYGYDAALYAFEKSVAKLGVETLDVFLLHQAFPSQFADTVEAYRALETLLADGRVRAIGVSNFMREHLEELHSRSGVVPAVNQIECHPYFSQAGTRATNVGLGIATQAWSPIGGITRYRGSGSTTFEDVAIRDIAQQVERAPAQVMLRWHLQRGRAMVVKSVTPERIHENAQIFDFELTDDQLDELDSLDRGQRFGPEPEEVTLENFGKVIPDAPGIVSTDS